MRCTSLVTALALIGCLIATGCRSTRPELQTWGERGGDDRSAPPPADNKPKLVSAQEAAMSAESARKCAEYAASVAAKDSAAGWTMLNACAGREDFTLLETLVNEPWLTQVKSPASATLVARVIANRGGDVYGDIKVLQERQVPLLTLEQALDKPNTSVNGTLLVRGELAEIVPADQGVTLKIVENSWHTDIGESSDDDTVMDSDERGGDQVDGNLADAPTPTGRTLFVSAGKLDPAIKSGNDWLLVVRFVSADKCKGAQTEVKQCGTGKLLNIGKAAAKLRDNW